MFKNALLALFLALSPEALALSDISCTLSSGTAQNYESGIRQADTLTLHFQSQIAVYAAGSTPVRYPMTVSAIPGKSDVRHVTLDLGKGLN